jgi:hypothetical protein
MRVQPGSLMGGEVLDGPADRARFVKINGLCFAPDGTAIGQIHLPERCANLCFGGLRKNRLFMAASQSLYALYVNTRGV